MTSKPPALTAEVLPIADDHELLRRYCRGDVSAFATIVRRYERLVFAAAIRRTRDAHLAEDVTQSSFLLLSQRAGKLPPSTLLPGWLHRTAGYAAANAIRMKRRRERHESLAAEQASTVMNEPAAPNWTAVEPLLDGAVDRLRDPDRTLILARFVQGLTLEQAAAAIGLGVEAARKRSQRAIAKLRSILTARGVAVSAAALTTLMSEHASVAAVAVPADLSSRVMTTVQNPAASPSAAAIAKGVSAMMLISRIKLTASVAAVFATLVGGAAFALSRGVDAPPSSPPAIVAPPVAGAAWGDVKEIVVNDDAQSDHDCIDLDTGATFTNNLRFSSREEGRKWWRDSGADAHCETTSAPEECGLYGMGVAWTLAANEAFDELPAADAEQQMIRSGIEPTFDNLMPADESLPVTYLFKTKDGAIGMLQMTGIERKENPRLTIRWKVIKRG